MDVLPNATLPDKCLSTWLHRYSIWLDGAGNFTSIHDAGKTQLEAVKDGILNGGIAFRIDNRIS